MPVIYRKTIGKVFETYYKLDQDKFKADVIEVRWKDKIGGALEGYFLNCQSTVFSNYDTRFINTLLETADIGTAEEWDKVVKQACSYARNM